MRISHLSTTLALYLRNIEQIHNLTSFFMPKVDQGPNPLLLVKSDTNMMLSRLVQNSCSKASLRGDGTHSTFKHYNSPVGYDV